MRGMASRLNAVSPAPASRSTRSRLDSGWSRPTSTAPLRRPSIQPSSGRPTVTSASAWASSSVSSGDDPRAGVSVRRVRQRRGGAGAGWTSTSMPWPVSRVTASGVRATRRSCSRRSVGTAIFIGAAILPSGSERGRQKRRVRGPARSARCARARARSARSRPSAALSARCRPSRSSSRSRASASISNGDLAARRQRHDAPLQVDRGLGRRAIEQLAHVGLGELDRQQADLGAVGRKMSEKRAR